VVEIRLARPADRPGLVALYQARTPTWALSLAREPVDGAELLEALLPGTRRHVALGPDGTTIIGTSAVSIAPTQFNGALVVGAYRWGSHVHPAYRGRGIGRALATRSWDDARAAGAEIGWGIAERSNEASARTFRHLGFRVDRTIQGKLILPAWPVARRHGRAHRAAAPADFPALADALNRYYAGHHLWWPLSAERLSNEADALGTPDANLLLNVSADGTPVAAAAVAVLGHALRVRRASRPTSWTFTDRLLGPPVSVQLLRYAMLPDGSVEAGAALLRQLQRRHLHRAFVLAANLDRLDPVWPVCARLPGPTLILDLWLNSPEPLASDRPCWIS